MIQERDGNNVPTVSYTRGTDLSGSLEGAGGIGGLLGRSHGYTAGNWGTHNFYHADGGGNITYLETSAQGLAASYKYDPYGNTISSSGTLAGANVYRFSSKESLTHNPQSGTAMEYYYYGYRWYAPDLQRWPNRDPLGEAGGMNLYTFVSNDPVMRWDGFGLEEVKGSGGKGGNCLSYALAPCTPGGEDMKGLVNSASSYTDMKAKVDEELKKHGCRRIKSTESCSSGEYQLNVYYWYDDPQKKAPAYHCSRQDPDGTWSQRNGPNQPVYTGEENPNEHIPESAKNPPPRKYCCPATPKTTTGGN